MAAAVAIGLAYSILQTVTAVVRLKKHNQGNILLDFYGDKVHIKREPTHKHTNNCLIICKQKLYGCYTELRM